MTWEEHQILLIKKEMYGFLNKKNFKNKWVEENSRDGGYVLFSNNNETVEVLIQFLPSYDILINYYPGPVKKFIQFLTAKKSMKTLSLKKELGLINIVDFETFLKNARSHIDQYGLLKRRI